MMQRYTVEEAVEKVFETESSSTSTGETTDSSDAGGNEKAFVPADSDTELYDSTEDEEMETEASGWRSRNRAINWSPTNDETLCYQPAPAAGPTRYTVSRIDTLCSSFNLLMPAEIVWLVVEHTNLHGR